jgi:hypothetical protein
VRGEVRNATVSLSGGKWYVSIQTAREVATQIAHVPQVCASRPGFDRTAFHAQFNAALVEFYRRTLGR